MTVCTVPWGGVEHRVGAVEDAVSTTELRSRIAGLHRLHRRALAEHHRLQAEVGTAPDATTRHHLRLEAAGVLDAAHGCQDEVARLRALAGRLRARGAAW